MNQLVLFELINLYPWNLGSRSLNQQMFRFPGVFICQIAFMLDFLCTLNIRYFNLNFQIPVSIT